MLQNAEEAEDISQDIFALLWRNRGNLKLIDNLDIYPLHITRNAVFRHIERFLLFQSYQSWQAPGDHPRHHGTEAGLNAKELELIIAIVVKKVPTQREKIYQMSREQGLNNEKIARELDISKRTVKDHLIQALADIRRVLLLVIAAAIVQTQQFIPKESLSGYVRLAGYTSYTHNP